MLNRRARFGLSRLCSVAMKPRLLAFVDTGIKDDVDLCYAGPSTALPADGPSHIIMRHCAGRCKQRQLSLGRTRNSRRHVVCLLLYIRMYIQ
jgi:hypothetical protein